MMRSLLFNRQSVSHRLNISDGTSLTCVTKTICVDARPDFLIRKIYCRFIKLYFQIISFESTHQERTLHLKKVTRTHTINYLPLERKRTKRNKDASTFPARQYNFVHGVLFHRKVSVVRCIIEKRHCPDHSPITRTYPYRILLHQ